MGFMEVIKGIPGLTHYYPLNAAFGLNDQVGTLNMSNVGSATIGSTTVGGVTLDAARFTGTQYLSVPDHADLSVTTTGELYIMCAVTIDNLAGASGASNDPAYYDWLSKGGTPSTLEYQFRLHRQGGTGEAVTRPLRHSAYHFNPSGGIGANDYLQPSPAGSDGGLWSNLSSQEATDAGTAGIEKIFGGYFTRLGTGSFPGYVQVTYNDKRHAYGTAALMSTGPVAPVNQTSIVRVGTAADGKGFLIGRVRRLAFFNRQLTDGEIATIWGAMSQVETSGGSGGNPNVSTFTETWNANPPDAAKYASTNAGNLRVDTTLHQLQLDAKVAAPVLQTVTAGVYNLDTVGIYDRWVPAAGPVGTSSTWMLTHASTAGTQVGFQIVVATGGILTIHAGLQVSSAFTSEVATTVYDPAVHIYFRMALVGSTVEFFTAARKPTGPTDNPWTSLGTVALPAYSTAARIRWSCSSGTDQTTQALVSEINGASSGGGGGGSAATALTTLVDQFSSQDATKWTFGTGASVTGGAAHTVTSAGVGSSFTSFSRFIATNSKIELTVVPALNGTGATTVVMLQNAAGTEDIIVQLVKTGVTGQWAGTAGYRIDGVYQSSMAMGSWVWTNGTAPGTRLRISQGTADRGNIGTGVAGRMYVDNGYYNATTDVWTWTSRVAWNTTAPTWLGDARVVIQSFNASGVSTDATFDDVNILPGAAAPITPGTTPLVDNFNTTLNTTLWDANAGTPTVSGGVLALDATSTPEVLASTTRINLTGTREYIEVIAVPTAAGAIGLFRLEVDAANALQWQCSGGVLQPQYQVGSTVTNIGGGIAFNATATRYISIDEAGGFLYWRYGPSPTSMTTVNTSGLAIPVSQVISLKVVLSAET